MRVVRRCYAGAHAVNVPRALGRLIGDVRRGGSR
jgi:hypothetical protein